MFKFFNLLVLIFVFHLLVELEKLFLPLFASLSLISALLSEAIIDCKFLPVLQFALSNSRALALSSSIESMTMVSPIQ